MTTPWALATRLTAWYALSSFLLVLTATLFLYEVLKHHVANEDDAYLADKIQLLRRPLHESHDVAAALHTEVISEAGERRYARVFIRVVDPDGHVLIETPDMSRAVHGIAFPPATSSSEELTTAPEVVSSDGITFRVASAEAPMLDGRLATLQIAFTNPAETELLARFRRWIVIVLALSGAACVIISHRLTRRGLKPLQHFAASVSGIGSASLDRRLGVDRLPKDLKTMGDSVNAMLDRIESAFQRLTRFSDDLAHELRTPVHNLRGEAEVALGKARSVEEYQDVLASCLEECQKVSRLIDALLFLARTESPRAVAMREVVNLSHELEALATFYRTAAEEVGVTLACSVSDGLRVHGEIALLQRAIGNLIENAMDHTPNGGRVSIQAIADGAQVLIIISDTGCGIPSEHLPYVFDRFHRVERAGNPTRGHLGLGLPIVRGIVTWHGGTADISSVPSEGTQVTIRLPSATSWTVSHESNPSANAT